MTSLKQKLNDKSTTISEKLFNDRLTLIKNKLLEFCDDASSSGAFSVNIPLTHINIDKKELEDEKSKLYSVLKSWASDEGGLQFTVLWHHGGCSYCEDCDSGCYPKAIHLNWN
jgi:hypothetical protein